MSNDSSGSQISGKKSVKPKLGREYENNTKYLEYNQEVTKSFKKDCEKFLLAFKARKDLDYVGFADTWRALQFSRTFSKQQSGEELIFANSAFFTIKKYIIFGMSIYIKVGAFYLLHGMYTQQPSKEKVRIRVTRDEYMVIVNLVEEMKTKENLEFEFLFTELKFKHAFQFVVSHFAYGLEPKFTREDKEMEDDIFVGESSVETITKDVFNDATHGLDRMNDTCKLYEDALKEYAADTGNNSILVPHETDIVQNLHTFCNRLLNETDNKALAAAPATDATAAPGSSKFSSAPGSSKFSSAPGSSKKSTPGKVKPVRSARK